MQVRVSSASWWPCLYCPESRSPNADAPTTASDRYRRYRYPTHLHLGPGQRRYQPSDMCAVGTSIDRHDGRA